MQAESIDMLTWIRAHISVTYGSNMVAVLTGQGRLGSRKTTRKICSIATWSFCSSNCKRQAPKINYTIYKYPTSNKKKNDQTGREAINSVDGKRIFSIVHQTNAAKQPIKMIEKSCLLYQNGPKISFSTRDSYLIKHDNWAYVGFKSRFTATPGQLNDQKKKNLSIKHSSFFMLQTKGTNPKKEEYWI